jgi:spore maturation protein CgeB
MRFTFFGSSIVSAYWNGAATYYRGLCAALHARGHVIRFVEQDIYDRQRHRDLPGDPPYCEVRVVAGWAALERELAAARAEADLIVKGNDTGALDREMEEWLVGPGAPPGGPPTAFLDVDALATLEECAAPSCYLRPLVPRFACVFTYGGGPPVVEGYRRLGARRVVPVYNAADPAAYHPVPPDPARAADLLLIASRLPDREARVREFFFRAAELAPERSFLLGGPGWGEGVALPPNVRWIGYVPTAEHRAWICSARMSLNVVREAMAREGFSPPTRVFEVAACGGCLVTDAWTGVEHFFAPGRELLVAADAEDVVAHLRTTSVEGGREIGRRARQRVLRDHTYTSRATLFDAVARELVAPAGGRRGGAATPA